MNLALMQKVLATYPDRPVLNEAEWPYRLGRLDEIVDDYMDLIGQIAQAPVKYCAPTPSAPPAWAGDISKQRRKRKL